MNVFQILFHLTGEVAFLGGLVLQYHSLLAPLPWHGGLADSSLYFVPYVEPQGYEPPNPCSPAQLSNATVHAVQIPSVRRTMRIEDLAKREGDGSLPQVSNIAVWLGPLGSCSRDEDGRTFCTKPSYARPQYNLTHIQANSVYWPARMSSIIPRQEILAVSILNCLGFFAFLIGSFPFWFPATYRRIMGDMKDASAAALPTGICFGLFVSAFAQFILNFFTHPILVNTYNSVDNFYLPAPCGTARQLKPGLLLKAVKGNGYNYIWIGWVLLNLYAGAGLVYRAIYISANFNKLANEHVESAFVKAEAQAAKARAKEEKKFKKEVEKEKIRLAALQQLEKDQVSNIGIQGVENGGVPPPQYVSKTEGV